MNNVAPQSDRLNKAPFHKCVVIRSLPWRLITKSAEESVLKSHHDLIFHHSMNWAFKAGGDSFRIKLFKISNKYSKA